MIGFAALLAAMPRDRNALPLYLQTAPEADRDACLALLSGQRPRRIASLEAITHWAADIAGIPDFLLAASITAAGDRAETAALLLPPPTGMPPSLPETLYALTTATPITAHSTLANLWSRLPPEANLILNRLASGTFRTRLHSEPEFLSEPRTCLAVLTAIEPAMPAATFAIRHGDGLAPLVRLHLSLPETAEILAWTTENTMGRFGPSRQVSPRLVFEISYRGTKPNPRRRCGIDLLTPEIIQWHRDLGPESASQLGDLAPPT